MLSRLRAETWLRFCWHEHFTKIFKNMVTCLLMILALWMKDFYVLIGCFVWPIKFLHFKFLVSITLVCLFGCWYHVIYFKILPTLVIIRMDFLSLQWMWHWIQIQLTQDWSFLRDTSMWPMNIHAAIHPRHSTACSMCQARRGWCQEMVLRNGGWRQDSIGPRYCQRQYREGGSHPSVTWECVQTMSCYRNQYWAITFPPSLLSSKIAPGRVKIFLV